VRYDKTSFLAISGPQNAATGKHSSGREAGVADGGEGGGGGGGGGRGQPSECMAASKEMRGGEGSVAKDEGNAKKKKKKKKDAGELRAMDEVGRGTGGGWAGGGARGGQERHSRDKTGKRERETWKTPAWWHVPSATIIEDLG